MQRSARRLLTLAFLGVSGCGEGDRDANGAEDLARADAQNVSVDLQGSYQLVRRELADGTVLESPAITGYMTYTGKYRNFHLHQPGAAGTPSSVSLMATYSVAGDEYSQTVLYEVLNNLPEGSGLDYNIPGTTFTTPISRQGRNVEFRDGEAGPVLSFSRDSMVATLDGNFVDRWVRVE